MSEVLQERSDPVQVAWGTPDGPWLMWNRYTGRFTYVLSNTPGTLPIRVEAAPWSAGVATLAEARTLARRFFERSAGPVIHVQDS